MGGGSALGFSLPHSLPIKGKPNSKKVQEREYDEHGDPKVDTDYTDHGNSKKHPNVPHKHI